MSPSSVLANVVDLFSNRIVPAHIRIEGGHIQAIQPTEGPPLSTYVLPGFVDAHVHVESSMLPPAEVARLVLPHGTVAMVADPHEIANVLGEEGIAFMRASAAQTPLHFAFGAPSCVPATPFETAGASLNAEHVADLLAQPDISFLAEVMNWPGVLSGDPDLMAKIHVAHLFRKRVDGHAPGLRGEQAERYIRAGIETDHECATLAEAEEKLAYGMKIALREGSAAKNLDALLPIVGKAPDRCFFCTDDCHPDDLTKGHINLLVERAVAAGVPLFHVLAAACKNPVLHYNLPIGLLRPGDPADFIEVADLTHFRVLRTVLRGNVVAENGQTPLLHQPCPILNCFHAEPISADDLRVPVQGSKVRVIVATDRQLVTQERVESTPSSQGFLTSDPTRDILKLVVVNRYHPAQPAVALLAGMGLQSGAIASSVAHDSHNIVACGVSDTDIATAVNAVIAHRGGLCVAHGHHAPILPLPIAGLMSNEPGPVVATRYANLTAEARALGTPLTAPFMTLAFMALLVIPQLKLSDKGLFCGQTFQFVPLFCGG
ncbi:MAG: adenine deaminase [Polyangiaceae bacterium]|nr:adenine deaminase [Polyangiaceae bacterium]